MQSEFAVSHSLTKYLQMKKPSEESTHLTRTSGSPLWVQFRDALRLKILTEDIAVNSQLPSEAELGTNFGISRIVVREGLSDLVRSGLIYKIRGKGTFVAARERDEDFVNMVLGHSDDMVRKGLSVKTKVLQQALRAVDDREARLLGLQSDSQVTYLERLRSVDGVNRLLVKTIIPADLAPDLHRTRLENKSLYETLRRQYGLRIVRAERWIEAVIPDIPTCVILELTQPEPLLRIESIAYSAGGRAIEHYMSLHRCSTSRLHFSTKL